MLIFPIMAIAKGKTRAFFYDYVFFFGILGSVFGIALPSTTQIYFAPFSFISTLTWIYHIFIGVGGVYIFASGKYFPKVSSLWRLVAVFTPLTIAAIIFNGMWQTNFVFLNVNKLYYPLDVLQQILGEYFAYGIAGFIIFSPFILLAVSLSVL